MSSALDSVRDDDCRHGYRPALCLACKSERGPKGADSGTYPPKSLDEEIRNGDR